MANANSAKGNPASHRMSNPNYKAKRVRNKNKNENHKSGEALVYGSVAGHLNKKTGKFTSPGIVGRSNYENFKKNDKMHDLKVENFGLGQREVRRILTGKNTNHNLTAEQTERLILIGHTFTTIMNTMSKN